MFHFLLLRPYLNYICGVRNATTVADSNKLERTQRKLPALYYNSFFPQVFCSYANAVDVLKMHTLRERKRHFDELFFIRVYLVFKCCPFRLVTDGLRVPAHNFSVSALHKVTLLFIHWLIMLVTVYIFFSFVIFCIDCGTPCTLKSC
jgi:hypothetical protein